MFKKRQKKQTLNLQQQLKIQDPSNLNQNQQNAASMQEDSQPKFSKRIKDNLNSLGDLQNYENIQQKEQQYEYNYNNERQVLRGHNFQQTNREVEDQELQKCFEEFKKFNEETQKNYIDLEGERKASVLLNRDVSDQEKIEEQVQEQMIEEQGRVEQMIIEDQEDGVQILEYREDYGQISPQGQSSEEYQDCYQNELIRKNMSRSTYLQLHPKLKSAHRQTQAQKLLKSLHKISQRSLHLKIQNDLHSKRLRKNQLRDQILGSQQKTKNKHKYLLQKRTQKEKIQKKFKEIQDIMKFVYYYGYQIKEFDQQKVLEMLNQEPNVRRMDRINRHRTKVIKKCEEYKKKKLAKDNNINTVDQEDNLQFPAFKTNKYSNQRKRGEEEEEQIEEQFDFPKKKNHKYAMNAHYQEEESEEDNDDIMDD